MEKRVWVFLWVRDFFWVLWSDCVLRLQISQFWSFVYVTLILLNLLFESLVLWLGLLKVYRLVTFHVSILFPHPCLCGFLHQFCRSVFVLDICCFIFTFSSHSSFFGFLLLPLSLWLVSSVPTCFLCPHYADCHWTLPLVTASLNAMHPCYMFPP